MAGAILIDGLETVIWCRDQSNIPRRRNHSELVDWQFVSVPLLLITRSRRFGDLLSSTFLLQHDAKISSIGKRPWRLKLQSTVISRAIAENEHGLLAVAQARNDRPIIGSEQLSPAVNIDVVLNYHWPNH
jgi:hypothetical protein